MVPGLTNVLDRKLQEAMACYQARDASGAEQTCREILQQSPEHPGALHLLGLAYTSVGRLAEAVAALSAAASRAPRDPVVHLDLGVALSSQGRHAEAAACFHRAAALDPENPGMHLNLGNALARNGRTEEALACYRKALDLDPGHLQALINLGNLLRAQGQSEQAAALYEKAIESRPDHPDAYVKLGDVRTDQGLYAGAQALYEKALSLDPDNALARNNLGNSLSAQHHWAKAVAQYERAIELKPGAADTQYNLGLAGLFCHEFERGWPGYEHRLQCPQVRTGLRKGARTLDLYERLPRWQGPIEEPRHEVAIWGEQGIGDQILFSTLIPELIGAGVSFIYEVDRRLLGAYERTFPGNRFVALSKPPLAPLTLTSRVLLAGSLPALFRRTRASFARQPQRVLGAPPERVAHYRDHLHKQGPGLKVALSWRSKFAMVRLGPRKSVPLMEFAPLLRLPGVHFVDAQYGDTGAERAAVHAAMGAQLLHFDKIDYYNNLEELLAILEACDLLITTSNVTAHLAGALGKRTWLLYLADRAPFYYWAHGGSRRSLWYPAVEIVTAPHLTEWASLIEFVAGKLAQHTRGKPG